MKRLFLITGMLLWAVITFGQLTGTKNIPGDYATLDAAITDLNAQGVGPLGVTINLLASNPQTTPSGGYAITASGNPNSPIVIEGNGNIITAFTPQVSGALNDAIFKIIGGDYITVQNFVMNENSSNTTTSASTNNMTEFGVALFYASTTNGPEHITIQNNTIHLGATYQNAFGIFATSCTNATDLLTKVDITSVSGAFNYLAINGNTIQNVNMGIVLVGSETGNYMANNLEIGNNTITFGLTGTFSSFINVFSSSVNGIIINNILTKNIHNNVLTSNGTVTSGTLGGIYDHANGTLPTTMTVNNNFNNNHITLKSATTQTIYGIMLDNYNDMMTNNVIGNTVDSIKSTVANGAIVYGIRHMGSAKNQYIRKNVFNLTPNTTANVMIIQSNNSLPANGTQVIDSNHVSLFTKSAGGGTVNFYYSSNSSPSTVTKYITNNLIENVTLTGATTFNAIYDYDGLSGNAPVKTISNNTIKNCTGGTSPIAGISVNFGTHQIYSNILENISNGANITAINAGGSATTMQNAYNNTIHHLTTTAGSIIGITCGASGTNALSNIYNNTIYDFTASAATSTSAGIVVTNGTTVNLYNNTISELYAPLATGTTAPLVAGIAVLNGINVNAYYNTVYLNATSTGTDFKTSGLYASTNTALKLVNNIIVNTSTANGAGITSAYSRSSITLTSYSDESDNNLFYAGTPSATNVIFYDGTTACQTLASYQALVGAPRDVQSVTELPPFVNVSTHPYDLHLQTTVQTFTESGGKAISGIDNDRDNDIRYGSAGYTGTGSAPDIGSDEFNGLPNFTCTTPVPGNTVANVTTACYGETIHLSLQNVVLGTGISYQWQSSTDGDTYTDVTGATNSTFDDILNSSIYYQCKVTCINGPSTVISTPVFIDLTNKILSTTGATICGTGTASLAATATAGATVNWYDALSGGNIMGTGSPFATPTISSTTTYYVAAETSSLNPKTITVGTGTSNSSSAGYTPFLTYYESSKNQILFLASEMQAAGLTAGNITSLAFNFNSVSTTPMSNFEISMKQTGLSNLTTTYETGLTTVYSSSAFTPAGTGWQTITLATPFTWDGISNIIIQICDGNNSSYSASSSIYYSTTSFSSHHYGYMDNGTGCSMTSPTYNYLSSYRPNIRFIGDFTDICTSPRVAVTATVTSSTPISISNDTSACNNTVVTLQVLSGLSDYDQFTWAPVTDLFTDAACTTPYTNGTNATKVYLKTTQSGTLSYICNGYNTVSFCNALDTVQVLILPATITIISTPEGICESGSATLSVYPTSGYGAATFQWAESSDGVTYGDISGETGFNYTTPLITTTTYYQWTAMLGTHICIQQNMPLNVNHPQVTSNTPGTRCGSGTINLSATGSTGTTIHWYDAATGGTLLGTGNNFTTPNIAATTSYYAAAEINPITIGTGSSTSTGYESPFYHYYGGKKSQYLVLASDLQAAGLTAGNIHLLAFDVVSAGTTYHDFNLKIGETTLSNLTTTFVSGLTDVYYNAAYTPTVGINDISFTAPFNWDGTSNIIVEFCWSNNNSGGTDATVKYDVTSYVSEAYFRSDNQSASVLCGQSTASYTMSALPQFMFNSSLPCLSGRTEVIATVTAPPDIFSSVDNGNICPGQTVNLSVTSSNTNYSYSWAPATVPSTGTNVTATPTVSTFYMVSATDAVSGCANTDTVYVNVYSLPVATALVDNSSIICNQSIQLTAGEWYTPEILSDNFNTLSSSFTAVNTSTGGNPAAAAWTLRPDGYTYGTFSPVTFHSNDNSQFYLSNSDAQGTGGTTHTELISPVFSSVGIDSVEIEVYQYYRNYNTDDSAYIQIFDGTQWNTLQVYTTSIGASTVFNHTIIPLSSTYLNNANLKIRFVYDAQYAYYWAIDNPTIKLYNANTFTWTSVPAGFTSNIYNPTDNPVVSTNYTVVVTSAHSCTNTASVSVTVNNPPAPVLTVHDTCGQSEIVATNYAGTLTWSTTSDINDTIFVNTNAPVTAFYTDGACVSDVASVTPAPITIPNTPVVSDIDNCSGSTVDAFTATSNYNNFVWYSDAALTQQVGTGSTFQSPETNVGTYTYYVVALNGICQSDTASATLTIHNLPSVTISENGDTLTSSSPTGNQWYNSNGPITGSIYDTLIATVEEDYYVVVTDSVGCSAMSNSIHHIPVLMLNNDLVSAITLMPNPAIDNVTVLLGNSAKATIQLWASDGKLIYNATVSSSRHIIPLKGIAAGIYTIKVTNIQGTVQKKLVVE